MEKGLLCCCTGLCVPPSGRVKKCKSYLFQRPEWTDERRETSLGGRGEVTWCKGKEGHVQWEQFLDLLTVAEVMLFIFGRLLMSGSASAPGRPGTWHALRSVRPGKKTLQDVPGLVVLTHSALLYNFSCGTLCRPLTLSQSVSLAPSPVSFLFRFYQFFQPNFFPLYLYTSPHHIHHRTLTSICCLPSISGVVIVFLLDLAGRYSQMVCCLLTNVSDFLASITGVAGWNWAGLNEIPKATISYFLTHCIQLP